MVQRSKGYLEPISWFPKNGDYLSRREALGVIKPGLIAFYILNEKCWRATSIRFAYTETSIAQHGATPHTSYRWQSFLQPIPSA